MIRNNLRILREPQDNLLRSGAHRRIERILDNMNLGFISEYPFPPFSVDIYFPEWHLGIEIDGPDHSEQKDRIRDIALMEKYGLKILHITARKYLSVLEIENKIIQFIEQEAVEGMRRKREWQTRP